MEPRRKILWGRGLVTPRALTGLRGIFRHEPILGVTRRCASHGRQRGSMTGRTGDVSEGSGTSRAPSR